MSLQRKDMRSILIIDDDKDDYDLVVEAMQEIDPEIAVSYISSCDEVVKYRRRSFDLVLLDINMPSKDGFYWLRCIRDHGYIDLPVIMFTNSLSPKHIARAYEEGANLYVSKPDSFPRLVKSLNEVLRMDWSDPRSITEEYRVKGDYTTTER
jgi:DNA-binding response OmpR family regulator